MPASPILRTARFTLVAAGIVVGLVPALLLRREGQAAFRPDGWGLPGIVLAAVGSVFYLWAAGLFALVGRGTPSPIDPPRTLVTTGPYRWTRNPLYVSALLVVCGESLLFRSPLLAGYAAVLWAFFAAFVVLVEEPHLRATFGDAYEEYRRTVPRWIGRTRS